MLEQVAEQFRGNPIIEAQSRAHNEACCDIGEEISLLRDEAKAKAAASSASV